MQYNSNVNLQTLDVTYYTGFAQATSNNYYYSEGTYGESTYSGEATNNAQNTASFNLANTGTIISFAMIVGAFLIISVILLNLRRKAKKATIND